MTKRFERKETKLKLLGNDIEILKAMFEARYLTAEQVTRLLFKPTLKKWAYARLRALFDMKFLGKRVTFANSPDVYFLGLRGRHYFEKLGHLNVDKIAGDAGNDPLDTVLWMPHELTLSKLYVNARLEAAGREWELEWRNSRVLELENLGVRPDAWIRVGKWGQMYEGYIEFSHQLTGRGEIEKKVKQYQGKGNVLWFTTTKAKLHTIESCLTSQFALALVDEAREWLTSPIWHWQGQVRPWIVTTAR